MVRVTYCQSIIFSNFHPFRLNALVFLATRRRLITSGGRSSYIGSVSGGSTGGVLERACTAARVALFLRAGVSISLALPSMPAARRFRLGL